MRLVRINEGEAIFEPFWEGGTSEYDNPHRVYSVLDEYTLNYDKNTIGQIKQGWAFVNISIDKSVKGQTAMSMFRTCNLKIGNYDTFKIFASFPEEMYFDVTITVDGELKKIANQVKGYGETGEYDFFVCGEVITSIRIDFTAKKDHLSANISWLGLADATRVRYMENHMNTYDREWTGLFLEKELVDIDVEIGILIAKEDIESLRTKLKTEPLKSVYREMKENAMDYMTIEPEQYIDTYIAKSDRRWCRDRDMKKPDMNIMMEKLAFVGLIEKDYDMLRMACRYALSASHCTYWCESIMGVFPGAIWHHRSFTEEIYCKSCSYVLDWAGSLLSPYGKQVIRDAIAMKGLPRLESDFKCVDYIRYINQGIVFSGGRVTGLLALANRYPRYHSNILEAEVDLIEMINNYIQEDGGTLEGPHYWQYTFSNILPSLYALARYKKQPFSIYAELLEKTGDFILAHLSQQSDGTILLPINDAHPGKFLDSTIAYSYYMLTGKKIWLQLYKKLLEQGQVSNGMFSLIIAENIKEIESEIKAESRFFCKTGQIDIHRKGKDIENAHLHYCSGETYVTHFHQDKGSIILEAEGKTLCPDCGSGYYHDTNSSRLSFANNHSLFIPLYDDGRLAGQPRECFGGIINEAKQVGDYVTIRSDETLSWEDGLMKSATRKILSPCAEVYIVIDQVELYEARNMQFLLNSYAPYEKIENNKFEAHFEVCRLKVMALNWQCKGSHVRQFLDGEKDDVFQLELTTNKSIKHFVVTAIIIEKKHKALVENDGDKIKLISEAYEVVVTINEDDVDVQIK